MKTDPSRRHPWPKAPPARERAFGLEQACPHCKNKRWWAAEAQRWIYVGIGHPKTPPVCSLVQP